MAQRRRPQVFANQDDLAAATARRWMELAAAAIAARRAFHVALSGGSTPRLLYQRLADAGLAGKLDWSRVHIYFGDERAVPPSHADSNYRMACEAFLDRVSIPPERIHRIRGEAGPERARDEYEEVLDRAFPEEPLPRFDLILLGLGEDGHTASLFPGSDALDVRGAHVTTAVGPRLFRYIP